MAPRSGALHPSRWRAHPGQIDVWLARIPSVGERDPELRAPTCLDAGELAACAAFHRPQDRIRAEVARAHLRETLSRYAPVRPEAWEFVLGEHGKPEVANAEGARLRFNLSHTQGLVACALTLDDDLGVDLEDTTREVEHGAVAGRVFSPAECAAFERLSPDQRAARFFEHWTLKEAYLKARGLGFALDPRNASFEFGTAGGLRASFEPEAGDRPEGWWFGVFEPDRVHVLALAARNTGPAPRVRSFFSRPGEARAQERETRARASTKRP